MYLQILGADVLSLDLVSCPADADARGEGNQQHLEISNLLPVHIMTNTYLHSTTQYSFMRLTW